MFTMRDVFQIEITTKRWNIPISVSAFTNIFISSLNCSRVGNNLIDGQLGNIYPWRVKAFDHYAIENKLLYV